jgi:hypothetical protein
LQVEARYHAYRSENTLGQYIASFVEWLTQNGADYFDAIAKAWKHDPRRHRR